MPEEIISFKMKFNRSLEPIKVMLISRKDELDEKAWSAFVEKTENSIIRHPEQYLGSELPQPKTLRIIVKTIFKEFVQRELKA